MKYLRSIRTVHSVALAALALCSLAGSCGNRNINPEPSMTQIAVNPVSPSPFESTPVTETARAFTAEPEASITVAVLALSKKAASLCDEIALEEFEASLAALSMDELDAVEALLETAVVEAERASLPTPSLRLALAACYGRKGLAEKAYAAVLLAEKEATAPGVSFSLAVIYGRKSLLAPSSDAKACTLVIESVPAGAMITVNGVAFGPAPARLEAVRPGRHEIRAVLAGYAEYIESVEAGPGTIMTSKVVLSPAPVSCAIDTEPSGAELWIDGDRAGTAPWLGDLLPGKHSLEARLAGYEVSVDAADVPIASTLVSTLRLSPKPAILVVDSEPSGSIVEFNGKELGMTPQRIVTTAFEARYVSLKPIDYRYEPSAPLPVELRPGEETKVSFKFLKKSAPLQFNASAGLPAGAVVLVDGVNFDTVPTGKRALEFGSHDVEIRADGFEPVSRRISWDGLWGKGPVMTRIMPAVPKNAIKVDGKVEDWAGVSPLFTDPAGDDLSPKVSGTDLLAVFVAVDESYLYVRMDFADGVFRADGSGWREQCLKIHGDRDGSSQYFIYLSLVAEDTVLEPRIRVNKAGSSGEPNVKRVTTGCSYRNGDGLVEMRFPVSAFAEYVQRGDVFNFWSHVGPDYPKGTDETERVDVRIR